MPLFALLGSPILKLVGSEAALPAYPVLLWLAAAALIELWSFPLEPALVSGGSPGRALAARVVSIIVFIPALLLLTGMVGVAGAGMATAFSALILMAGQAFAVRRLIRRRPIKNAA